MIHTRDCTKFRSYERASGENRPSPSSLVTGFWSMYTKEVYVFTDTRVSPGEHTTPHCGLPEAPSHVGSGRRARSARAPRLPPGGRTVTCSLAPTRGVRGISGPLVGHTLSCECSEMHHSSRVLGFGRPGSMHFHVRQMQPPTQTPHRCHIGWTFPPAAPGKTPRHL